MNGFISALAAQLASQPVSPAADGPIPRPRMPAADGPAPRDRAPPRQTAHANAALCPAGRARPPQPEGGFAGEMQARLVLSGQAWQLMSAMCCPGTGAMATCACNVLSAVQRWQDAREMRSGRLVVAICRRCAFPSALPWQNIDAMRSRTPCRGKFFASCIPEGAPDGKSAPSWQHIAAMYPK